MGEWTNRVQIESRIIELSAMLENTRQISHRRRIVVSTWVGGSTALRLYRYSKEIVSNIPSCAVCERSRVNEKNSRVIRPRRG
jgi:hypothetical protein